jgi:hypothetical protein
VSMSLRAKMLVYTNSMLGQCWRMLPCPGTPAWQAIFQCSAHRSRAKSAARLDVLALVVDMGVGLLRARRLHATRPTSPSPGMSADGCCKDSLPLPHQPPEPESSANRGMRSKVHRQAHHWQTHNDRHD